MATIAPHAIPANRADFLSGTTRAHALDRWIYVFTATLFVVITLVGFIPDSLNKIAAVQTGARPPLPLIMHLHAILMASFLLLLLTQTWLAATGRTARHIRLGLAAKVLVPALVVAGFILAPTMYHETSRALQAAAPEARGELQAMLARKDNILLIQTRIGLTFSLFLTIGLYARTRDSGLHKRMMILGTAMVLPAAIDRIGWLPSTLPANLLSTDLYTLLAVTPMFAWDVIRNRTVHRAYLIWLALNLPFAIALYGLWNTPWWHATARQIMGV